MLSKYINFANVKLLINFVIKHRIPIEIAYYIAINNTYAYLYNIASLRNIFIISLLRLETRNEFASVGFQSAVAVKIDKKKEEN